MGFVGDNSHSKDHIKDGWICPHEEFASKYNPKEREVIEKLRKFALERDAMPDYYDNDEAIIVPQEILDILNELTIEEKN